ncbi:class I SAM-dependent methyltransferase [Actinokineospora sp. G85]|uniref:class I SAM-dependent methyltransferase n=1 Tax=Actinokineospora sp. G85 TaxID=3406626 RepID=UPI003C716257
MQPARDQTTTELLLGSVARLNDRRVSAEQIDHLAAQLHTTTGVVDPYPHIAQTYRTLVDLELRCVGRIAGTTSNVIGKLAAAPLLAGAGSGSLRVLEIGTLFGVFAAGLHRQLLRYGKEHDLTIVDPLESIQLQPERERAGDPSGTPVTEATVRANMRFGGVDTERLRIVRGFSTDAEVQEQVGEGYDLIVVDGDHSRAGVFKDLRWAEEIANPGAVVVVDDYGDPGWPGVAEALDDHRKGGSRMRLAGVVATSAFLTLP